MKITKMKIMKICRKWQTSPQLTADYLGALKFTEPDRPHVKVEIDDCRIPCLIDSRCPGFTDNSHAEIIEKLNPEDVELLNRWIIKNYPTLINHWKGLITDKQALNTLCSV